MSLYISGDGPRKGKYDESVGLDIDGDVVEMLLNRSVIL